MSRGVYNKDAGRVVLKITNLRGGFNAAAGAVKRTVDKIRTTL